MKFRKNVDLSSYTSIKLGGPASEFCEAKSVEDLKEAVLKAKAQEKKIWIMGGGSNTVFKDSGFDGIVIKINFLGIETEASGGFVFLKAWAGENWDDVVSFSVKKNLAGLECLSGIPGTVGAAPVQNIGAYGQEVSDAIDRVGVLDMKTLEQKEIKAKDCKFEYRSSRFKKEDKGKYVIIYVVFRLVKDGVPKIAYPELEKMVKESCSEKNILKIRELVLNLRKSKSMIVSGRDKNSVSCGSFFTNPCLTQKEFISLKKRNERHKGYDEIPFFETSSHMIKIPAAWLIEQSGFTKGFRHMGAKISDKHCLSLVNDGGTAKDVLELAGQIKSRVFEKFGIKLEIEPDIVE